MGAHSSKAGSGGSGSFASSLIERNLKAALSPIDESKTGASFRKLSANGETYRRKSTRSRTFERVY